MYTHRRTELQSQNTQHTGTDAQNYSRKLHNTELQLQNTQHTGTDAHNYSRKTQNTQAHTHRTTVAKHTTHRHT